MKTRQRISAVLALWFLTATLHAADSTPPVKVTAVEGITEYRLDNGLKVLLFPDPSKPTVTVNLTLFVGSRHEGYGEGGMAHLLEHMLFKGTPTHQAIPKLLKDRGAEFNGTTWLDRTNYYETLTASDENLEFAIRLEADRMLSSTILAEDLASEMSVVRNEFERLENNPSVVLMQRMLSSAFLWHNYGQSTIGNRADIERVPVDRLRVFYRKYYQPDNAMLVVAGRFEESAALQLIQEYFGTIPRPERQLETTYTEEPPQDGERIVTLRRVGDVAVVGVVYHIVSGPHPDFAAVDVLESILTAPPAGRLYKALVETKKSASVSGGAFALHDPGVLELTAEVTTGNEPQVVLDTLLDVAEQVSAEGVAEDEVERGKQRLLKHIEIAAADSQQSAIELSEWASQGDWRLKFLYRDRVEQVTAEDVKRVAAGFLQRNNRTVGLYLPVKSPERVAVPPTPELAKMIGDYRGRETISAGEEFDPTPANIDARAQRFEIGDGLQAVFVPKKNRGETVELSLTLRYGDEENLKGLKQATEFLPQLMQRGTQNLTRQQLQDELDKHRAQLQASGSPGTATFSLQTQRPHLMAVLGLLRQVLREPTLPEQELDILKQVQLTRLEQRRSDPQALGISVLRRKFRPYLPDDPRYEPTIEEEIALVKALDRAAIQRVYSEYLGAAHGELAVVGDFDLDAVKKSVGGILGDWKASNPYAHLNQHGNFPVKGGTTEILTPDKANAMYFAGVVVPMRDDHPDYPALLIGNYILGGGALSSRLGDRIRQKEGLAYGVASFFQALSLDERASLTIFASCNPQNIGKVQIAVGEEIERLLKQGITEQELVDAKSGYLKGQQVNRTDDGQVAQTLTQRSSAGRTMQYDAEFDKDVEELTGDQVVAALRKYFDPKRFVIVVAGDFKKDPKDEKTSRP